MFFQAVKEIITTLLTSDFPLKIAISSLLLLILVILSHITDTDMEKLFLWSFLRGFLQILLIGSILMLLFELDQLLVLYAVLSGMCAFATFTLSQRYPYPHSFLISFIAITSSSLLIMSMVMFSGVLPHFSGIIPYPPTGEYVITMGSTVISNTMAITSIVLERIKSDTLQEKGKIEAALSLGAKPSRAMHPIIRNSLRAGLRPTANTVAVLGIVKIPGWMSGMIVGGASPIEAAIYQVIIYLMLLSSAFIASVITSILFTREFFTDEYQFSLTFLRKLEQDKEIVNENKVT